MSILFDPEKRRKALDERGLDFLRADEVFAQRHVTVADTRRDYGEKRYITIGLLDGRMVVMVWTERGDDVRMISMRKANDREQAIYGSRLVGH
ncbi:BrnT family toxin [Rhizobium glycinendophyticum]|uniref:BrnT family toxin n=1 Tax=Rhizobium glycinendophyticum TaxID=2589807 RepID=A0A504U5Q3_9HYPH|nr:BrnT family toxin [Rhizobium glycinendophyticum]TPP10338.1 BrnT family toxin [Rhizobium glycinendophyticum]